MWTDQSHAEHPQFILIVNIFIVLIFSELTPEDHGEYICRLHDFDRNVLAQQSVPIIVFGKTCFVTEMSISIIAELETTDQHMHYH